MGTIPNPKRTVDVVPLLYDRVLSKVKPCETNGGQCQLWTGYINNSGYGVLKMSHKGYLHVLLVHNAAYCLRIIDVFCELWSRKIEING